MTNQHVFIIAEACDNHFGSLKLAKEMARRGKQAGADAIKYQHHLPDEEMLPDIPMSDNFSEPLYEFLKKNALSLEAHVELSRYCDQIGIEYMCTPFSYQAAVEIAENTSIKRIKIGSGEQTDYYSLKKIAALGLPMILSTGMSTLQEIDETYEIMRRCCKDLSLLNCVSEYPPVYEDMNLLNIVEMKRRYPDARIGHSDHTPDLYTSFAAVALGAAIIEKHVILDKSMPGPDQSVSIDFGDLENLVDGIRKIEAALGREKIIHGKEKQIRAWAFRSVVTKTPIAKGQKISEAMLTTKRPGTGIPSKDIDQVIGKTAAADIPANVLMKWDDLEVGDD